MNMVIFRKGMVFAVIVLFVGAGVVPSISGDIERNIVTYEDFDVGIIPPSTIVNGDIRSTGEDSYSITKANNGDVPASVELDFKLDLLDGFEWEEVDSGSKGPYDLDPDAWIESFFDVVYDTEGYYRATFSLDTPLEMLSRFTIGNDWFDDNPDNDVYQAVFTVTTNNPPNKPVCSYDSSSDELVITVTDPDGDQVYYLWDWGDETVSEWLGPYDSGDEGTSSHVWDEEGNYEIKVKTKDIKGEESDWSDPLPISMPKNKLNINSVIQEFLKQHPHLFPILKLLLKL